VYFPKKPDPKEIVRNTNPVTRLNTSTGNSVIVLKIETASEKVSARKKTQPIHTRVNVINI